MRGYGGRLDVESNLPGENVHIGHLVMSIPPEAHIFSLGRALSRQIRVTKVGAGRERFSGPDIYRERSHGCGPCRPLLSLERP